MSELLPVVSVDAIEYKCRLTQADEPAVQEVTVSGCSAESDSQPLGAHLEHSLKAGLRALSQPIMRFPCTTRSSYSIHKLPSQSIHKMLTP